MFKKLQIWGMVYETTLCSACQHPSRRQGHKMRSALPLYGVSAHVSIAQIHAPGIRARIINLALNGSGVRNTARFLGISTQAVMVELKNN